jgi:hypothetical protein
MERFSDKANNSHSIKKGYYAYQGRAHPPQSPDSINREPYGVDIHEMANAAKEYKRDIDSDDTGEHII